MLMLLMVISLKYTTLDVIWSTVDPHLYGLHGTGTGPYVHFSMGVICSSI